MLYLYAQIFAISCAYYISITDSIDSTLVFSVEVEYNEGTDLFDVRLIKNGKVVETVEDVYLDSLVDVIDYRVEKVDNYKQKVEAEYSHL